MSSAGLPSAEVAADFRDSLQDLQMNNRYEISNLTIIAKENTEYAQAISRELEHHIRTTSPSRKLPALYVLDSIVKNVGTPYTVYLGRNLYSTFMDAYTLVDGQTRKNMEGMLKTWKEPVPGSMDPRPVFSADVTRPIENALIKARTATLQYQQQARSQSRTPGLHQRPSAATAAPYRNTPTPPGMQRYPTPSYGNMSDPRQQQPTPQQYPPRFQTQPGSTPSQSYPAFSQQFAAQPNVASLSADVEKLIAGAKSEFATDPLDTAVQQRLKALLDLQTILTTQQLPPDALRMVQEQLALLAPKSAMYTPPVVPPHTASTPQVANPYQPIRSPPLVNAFPALTGTPQLSVSQPYQSLLSLLQPTPTQAPLPTPYPPPPQPQIPANLLATLLGSAGQAATPAQSAAAPLPLRQASLRIPPAPPASVAPTQVPQQAGSLLDSLRAAGLLPPATPAAQPAPVAAPSAAPASAAPQLPASLSALLAGLPLAVPQPPANGSARPNTPSQIPNGFHMPSANTSAKVALTPASLKIARPELIGSLYSARPNQCSTCGRRFTLTDEGRQQKAKHLDWHFRVNQRLADVTKRGVYRSWYLDVRDWIDYKEVDEATDNSSSIAAQADAKATAASRKDPKQQYIPIPTDATLSTKPCPICQEQFDKSWHDKAQEWVWMDAIKVGGQVYHASCYEEMRKAPAVQPRATPEPEKVLGKRKPEEDLLSPLRSRIKTEQSVS